MLGKLYGVGIIRHDVRSAYGIWILDDEWHYMHSICTGHSSKYI